MTSEDLVLNSEFRDLVMAGEYAQAKVWAAQRGFNSATVEIAIGIIDQLKINERKFSHQELLHKWALLKGSLSNASYSSHTPQKSKSSYSYLVAAAIVILVVIFGVKNIIEADKPTSQVDTLSEAVVEKQNPVGVKSTIYLNDGTRIILNADSKISYRESTLADDKEVVLEYGEAYFEVAPNKDRLFWVSTGNISIKVTGTSFNVSAYPEESESVSLYEGSIELDILDDGLSSTLSLSPLQRAWHDSNENLLQVTEIDPTAKNWTRGILTFQAATLAEIIKKLERWYGVNITVDGVEEGIQFTGHFENKSLESVLNGLCYSLNCKFKIQQEGATIILQ